MLIKAVTHIHSEWSHDADWPLGKIARLFKCLNHRVVLMTEHDISFNDIRWGLYREACRKVSTNGILLIPGIEYSDPTNTIHILVWGDLPFLGNCKHTQDILTQANELGGVSVWAHPMRKKAESLFQQEWFNLLLGIEEWNRKFDGIAPSNESVILRNKYKLVPFFGLDFHQINQFAPLAMNIRVDKSITSDNVLRALKNRHCSPQIIGLSTNWSTKISQSVFLIRLEKMRRVLRSIIKHKKE